jgi:hypothetical protein
LYKIKTLHKSKSAHPSRCGQWLQEDKPVKLLNTTRDTNAKHYRRHNPLFLQHTGTRNLSTQTLSKFKWEESGSFLSYSKKLKVAPIKLIKMILS